ncbi:MAG: hypothetical protein ABEL97_14270 [Salinibacter sp.]
MTRRRGLAIAGGLLLIGAALYWGIGDRFAGSSRSDTATADRIRIPADVVDGRRAWPVAASPAVNGVRVRLRYPPSAAVDTTLRPGPSRVRVTYAGPGNDPPALTDGFSVTVTLRERSANTPLDTLVRRSTRATRRVGGPVLAPVRDTSLLDRPARRWTQESAMGGAVDHHLVALSERTVAHVTASVVGADTARYERTIDVLRRTLRVVHAQRRPSGRSVRSSDSLRVTLALLRRPTGTSERGCDDVAWVSPRVPSAGPTAAARLETALRALFALDTDSLDGARHFLARTTETLSLDSTAVVDGVAHIYLRGTLTGLRGVCDHPRARIQIEETARALPFVDRVVLYRNGRRSDLTPGGLGGRVGGAPGRS